jgi:hypothetical protein
MKQHQKTHDQAPQNAASGEPGDDGLATAQKQMNDLLAAGDAAINAALSGDSAAFLASAQQHGGE